ncbi:hypothetical protein GEMRC1_011842 [Eukaryota sp. GEM-RC1]
MILYRSGSSPDHIGHFNDTQQIFKIHDGHVYTKHDGDDHCDRQDLDADLKEAVMNFIRLALPPFDAERSSTTSYSSECELFTAIIPYYGTSNVQLAVDYCVDYEFNYRTRVVDSSFHDVIFDERVFSDHERLESSDWRFNVHDFCSNY